MVYVKQQNVKFMGNKKRSNISLQSNFPGKWLPHKRMTLLPKEAIFYHQLKACNVELYTT